MIPKNQVLHEKKSCDNEFSEGGGGEGEGGLWMVDGMVLPFKWNLFVLLISY